MAIHKHAQNSDRQRDLSDAYFLLLGSLSADRKLELAQRLIESVRKPRNSVIMPSSEEGFIPELSAEALMAELRNARHFSRDLEEF